jgi:hypothetical protein
MKSAFKGGRIMSFKYGVLCFVLLLVVLFLGVKSYDALTHPLGLIPEKEAIKKELRPGSLSMMGVNREPTPIASYHSIAEKNIFNPERKDFPAMASGPGTSTKPVARPQIILYGVTLAGDHQSAFVVNPGRSLKKGEREQMTIKLGERIGEYKLAKVLSDRITLEAEGDTLEVLLHDPKMPKKRTDIKTESKPAMISSAGSSSTAPGEAKRESVAPKDISSPPTTPRVPSRRPLRAEGIQEIQEPSQAKGTPSDISSPMTPSPIPSTPVGSPPTPMPVPASPSSTMPMPTPIPPSPSPMTITPPPRTGGPVPSSP